MKRKFLAIVLIALIGCLTIGLYGCKKKETTVDITNNISYAETHRYVGIGEMYKVSVASGIREKLFVIDGKATDVQPYSEISIMPLTSQQNSKKYSYTLYYDGGEISGELSRDVVTHSFKALIDTESFKDKITKIAVTDGKDSEEILLENALNGKISYDKVLEIAKTQLKDEIDANTTDGVLNREIIIKLVRDRRNADSPYYWYISFISSDSTYWAILINPETGEIISTKK